MGGWCDEVGEPTWKKSIFVSKPIFRVEKCLQIQTIQIVLLSIMSDIATLGPTWNSTWLEFLKVPSCNLGHGVLLV